MSLKNVTGLVILGTALGLVVTAGAPAVSAAPKASGLPDLVTDGTDQPGGARRLGEDRTESLRNASRPNRPKNVILVIGDGMGDSEITVGRNYLVGAGGYLDGLDALPITGQMTHYSVDKDTGKPDYVGDSAATGTAWATGVKTYDNAVSVDRFGQPQRTILQIAKDTGRATGNVTTSEIQDATPAVLVANISQRRCYGPVATTTTCPEAALENGGKGSITEQLLDTRPDVTLGGGSATFAEVAKAGQWAGQSLEAQAKARGFTYMTNSQDLANIPSANQRQPLLGVFAPGNLPTKFAPLIATADGADGEAKQCAPEPTFALVPSLKAMTDKAIQLLSTSRPGRTNGFFLQIESASIDKRDHAADACGQIGETAQMNEAVASALAFAKREGNTLVLVTADHAHTSQIVDDPTPGLNVKLRTADESDMIVAYGTAPSGGSQQHTGTQVRVAGYGPGAGNVSGLIDQTDLFYVMRFGMQAWKP
jgi:alkaline phosphatase